MAVYCMQCGEYFAEVADLRHVGHDHIPRELAAEVCEESLTSLLQSAFSAYALRPCIGLPRTQGQTATWRWVTFAEVLQLAYRYVSALRPHRHRYAVISFGCSCVELVAADLAAALLGMCSVVVAHPEQQHHVLQLLDREKCAVIDRIPANDVACFHSGSLVIRLNLGAPFFSVLDGGFRNKEFFWVLMLRESYYVGGSIFGPLHFRKPADRLGSHKP